MTKANEIVPTTKCGFCGSVPDSNVELSPEPKVWGVQMKVIAHGGWVSKRDFHVCEKCIGVLSLLVRSVNQTTEVVKALDQKELPRDPFSL
jgi:hypothetical protein